MLRSVAGKTLMAARPFDFTSHTRALCGDLVARLPELSHIDMSQVAIRFCQARHRTRYGIFASLTPLRFEGGRLIARRGGKNWSVERLYDDAGREMLYLLSFYLPRFLDRPFADKLATTVHELWHIGPDFDGDLRRHPGRCYAHSRSKKEYDAQVAQLVEKCLSLEPPPELYEFLKFDFQELHTRHGAIVGQRIRAPRLIPAG